MKRRASLLVTFVCCVATQPRSQTEEQAKAAAAGVVAAVNAKDSKLLKPLLSDRCTVRGLTPEQFPSILDEIVAGWSWQVVAHRVDLKPQGRALVTFVAANKGEWAFTLQLDAAGKIVELSLFTAEAGKEEESTVVFTGPDSSVVPLVRSGELWAVRAKLDDKDGLWEIDTGTPKLVLDATAFPALRQGGTTSRTFTFSTSVTGASARAEVCDVGTFEIGGQVASKLRATRMDLAHLAQRDDKGAPIPLLGALGKRELAAFEARFDFEAGTLTLVKLNDAGEPVVPRPASLTERFEFELHRHLPLLHFTAGDTRLGLVFDTGAGGNVLHERYAADPALTLDNVTTAEVKGTTPDKASAKCADVSGLRINGGAMPPMRTVFMAKMAADGIDGIVGLPWVAGRPFALNYAQKCIVFGPRR